MEILEQHLLLLVHLVLINIKKQLVPYNSLHEQKIYKIKRKLIESGIQHNYLNYGKVARKDVNS